MEWNDAEQLAGSAPASDLNTHISQLQAVRREVNKLQPPSCAAALQNATIASMEASIEAYLSFVKVEPSSEFEAKAELAQMQARALADIQARFDAGQELKARLVEFKAGGRSRLEVAFLMDFNAAMAPVRADDAWSMTLVLVDGQSGQFFVEARSYPGELFCEVYSDGQLVERQTSNEEKASIICAFTLAQ